MQIEQIQYLVEVARVKSISVASKNLFVTQSALSQSISNLEMELGMKLFTRSRRGTIPTPEGENIIKKAVEIVLKLQEIKEEAQDFSDILNGELRIVSIPVGLAHLVKTVSSFKCDYPQMNFRIAQSSSKEILQDINEHKADLGLIAMKKDLLKEDKSFSFEPFWEGKMVIGVSKNSPLASLKSIDAKELLNHPFVLYEEEYVQEFIKFFTDRVGPLQKMFTSNNPTAILYALEGGLAVTCGYDFTFFNSPMVLNGDLVVLEIDNYEQEIIVFGWASSNKSTISKRFVTQFSQEFQYGNLR